MPIRGAKYRFKTTSTGKKVRLAFVDGEVEEAKSLREKLGFEMRPPAWFRNFGIPLRVLLSIIK